MDQKKPQQPGQHPKQGGYQERERQKDPRRPQQPGGPSQGGRRDDQTRRPQQ